MSAVLEEVCLLYYSVFCNATLLGLDSLFLELVYSAAHGMKIRKLARTGGDLLLTHLLGILTWNFLVKALINPKQDQKQSICQSSRLIFSAV